jgi:hypothetical protein
LGIRLTEAYLDRECLEIEDREEFTEWMDLCKISPEIKEDNLESMETSFKFGEIVSIDLNNSETKDEILKSLQSLSQDILNISNDLKFIKKMHIQDKKTEIMINKWNLAASVIDRLFLIIAVSYAIIILVVIILTDTRFYRFTN